MPWFSVHLRARDVRVPVAGVVGPTHTFVTRFDVDAADGATAEGAGVAALRSALEAAGLSGNAPRGRPTVTASFVNPSRFPPPPGRPPLDVDWTWSSEDPTRPLPELPEADAVVVVDCRGRPVGPRTLAADTADAPAVPATPATAAAVLRLWRAVSALPPGREGRCHIPAFALRFGRGGDVAFQASLCWRCNNIYGTDGRRRFKAVFDGDGAVGRELFATLERVVSDGA